MGKRATQADRSAAARVPRGDCYPSRREMGHLNIFENATAFRMIDNAIQTNIWQRRRKSGRDVTR